MKILIIDRDELSAKLFASKLVAEGHEVMVEPVKNEAIEKIEQGECFDIIFIDPSPMKDAMPIILNIRRAVPYYCYIMLMVSEDDGIDRDKVLSMGGNNFVRKPVDAEDVIRKISYAKCLDDMMQKLGDETEDFPSAGGVIAKSAFNQLFLSAMDRGNRYSELAYILSIGINNYKQLESAEGPYVAEYAASKLAKHLVDIRRQSDIIGQTEKSEYSLLLQRTSNPKEANEAAKRFAATIEDLDDMVQTSSTLVEIYVRLINVPQGISELEYVIHKKPKP